MRLARQSAVVMSISAMIQHFFENNETAGLRVRENYEMHRAWPFENPINLLQCNLIASRG